jgi:hypothetical protein
MKRFDVIRALVMAAPALLGLALAGCGGAKKGEEQAANHGPAKHKSPACTGFPDYIALTPDADVETCDSTDAGKAHVSGKIVFYTDEKPQAVVAFFRGKANGSGIPDGIVDNNPDSPMYSASDSTSGRSVTVTTSLQAEGGTEVTVDWAKENWDAPKAVHQPSSNNMPVS